MSRRLVLLFSFLSLTLLACEADDSGGGRAGSSRADTGGGVDVVADAGDVAAPEDVAPELDATPDASQDVVSPPDVAPDTEPPPPVRFITDEGAFNELELLIKGAKETVDMAHFEANDDDSDPEDGHDMLRFPSRT